MKIYNSCKFLLDVQCADDIPFVLRPEEFIVIRFDESDEYPATNMQLVHLPLVGNWFADKNNYHNIEIVGMKNSFTLPEYVFLLIDKKFEKQHRV